MARVLRSCLFTYLRRRCSANGFPVSREMLGLLVRSLAKAATAIFIAEFLVKVLSWELTV